ncbi:ATP-binding protein [Micromonospora mirobrigensis]|uniref:Histidine kinase-like ATPase domain-containing protein n=1 Tax=Micromonospora mirobrigensis TaxID=262898 RepID=A0A1C4WAJ4_9ACTN|nr:ATP-binding protein [Micromonospora mirobrigensis]SCE93235.1 Histidine kinase-like ATPase domain-containing protein [Micromonospora mirobrigensis]
MGASRSGRTRRPAATATILAADFTAATVTALRHRLKASVTTAGLTGDSGDDFVLAVHELVTNAVRHGGGRGRLTLYRTDDVLVCEVSDDGDSAAELPVQLPATDIPGGRGLWLAHRFTEGLILTRGVSGVTATVTACLTPAEHPRLPGDEAADPVPSTQEDERC